MDPQRQLSHASNLNDNRALRLRRPLDDAIAPTDRVLVAADAANFQKACTAIGLRIDHAHLLDVLGSGRLVGAHWFDANFTRENPAQLRFHDVLAHQGWTVHLKEPKTLEDHRTGESVVKANVDLELALGVMAMVGQFDCLVLLGGDGDFAILAATLRALGKRCFVVSTRATLGRELLMAANKPVLDLSDLRSRVERPERHTRVAQSRVTRHDAPSPVQPGRRPAFDASRQP